MSETSSSGDQRDSENLQQFQSHETLLRDRSFVSAFHDAIMNNRHLFRNKVVLEVGSGTALLSMFAAKAGAKRVFAVDSCPIVCHIAEQLIRSNHFEDKIQVINRRIEEIDKFDEKIDIILSDWMGFYLFHESLLDSIIYARDHFLQISSENDDLTPDLNESISIFPSHAYLYCAPFVDQHIRIESNSMWKDYFDLNFSPILPYIKNSDLRQYVVETIESSQLVQEGQLIQSIDLRTVKKDDLRSMRSFCEFQIENTCIISGFCFWFDCYFSTNNNSSILRSTRLTTSPHSTKTHWKQTLVFLPQDLYPLKGDIVPVNIKLRQSNENHRHYQLTIVLKKIKENSNPNNSSGATADDDLLHPETTTRRRQRRRSSTISSDKRFINENKSPPTSSDSSSSNSDNDDHCELTEHPIPCSCDRNRCKLIKTIIEKYNEENLVE